jgi:hypothetical protein
MIVVGNVPVISWREQATFQWDDVCFVIDRHALLDFNSTSSFVRLFQVRSIIYIWPSTLCTYVGCITVQYNTDINLNQIKFYLHSKSYNVVKIVTPHI